MIFSGPFDPKFMAEACVASEKVGEGGPGVAFRQEVGVMLIGLIRRDEGMVGSERRKILSCRPRSCGERQEQKCCSLICPDIDVFEEIHFV
jgi:hypothetical protein